jgi:site-specific recombinase XerD
MFALLLYPIRTDMARIKKPTIKIVLRKGKTLANGNNPIYLRLTFNRKAKYYVLKGEQETLSCQPKKWNEELGRFNRNKELNHFLDQYELRAKKVLRELESIDFTFVAFENKYFRRYDRQIVISYFDHLIEKLIEERRLGSAYSYKDTRNRINEYKPDIHFQDLDFNFLERFEKHLLAKGNSINSIGIYMRTLRAVFNKAIADDLVKEDLYPFKKYKIKTGNATKRALTKRDMLKIIRYKAEKGSSKWHSLNLFTFSYLTRGMNLKDMALLTWKKNIIGDKIVYLRAKTSNTKKSLDPHIIKIEPEIDKILKRYPKKSDFVFPILEPGLTDSTIRHRIKNMLKKISTDITEIATELKIECADQITHYWARHTYATTLKRSGISTAVISEALGHSSETTTKAYLDKFEQSEIDNTFKHLL